MSISSTVASLAKALEAHTRDPELKARLAQLAEMPAYVDQSRLDLWEEKVKPARGDVAKSPAHDAMIAIMELGLINMYGEIDDELTAEYIASALSALDAAGVKPGATEYDVADW